MTPRTRFWLAFWSAFGIGNFLLSLKEWSLCETVRDEFHMDTREGLVTFSALFWAGMAVLHKHVRKPYSNF